jgi:hypothetical protein
LIDLFSFNPTFVTNSEQIQLHWPDVLLFRLEPKDGFSERAAVRSGRFEDSPGDVL